MNRSSSSEAERENAVSSDHSFSIDFQEELIAELGTQSLRVGYGLAILTLTVLIIIILLIIYNFQDIKSQTRGQIIGFILIFSSLLIILTYLSKRHFNLLFNWPDTSEIINIRERARARFARGEYEMALSEYKEMENFYFQTWRTMKSYWMIMSIGPYRRAITKLDLELERVEKKILDCHVGIANQHLQEAEDLLAEGKYEEAASKFADTHAYLEDLYVEGELVEEVLNRAQDGWLTALLDGATKRYEDGDFHRAREGFEAAVEVLTEMREEAFEHNSDEKVAELDALIESCEKRADRARRKALVDIDESLSRDLGIPETSLSALTGDPLDNDFDIDPNQSVPTGITDDLRAELPDHEILIERHGIGGNADVHKIRLTDSEEVVALKVPRWEGTLNSEIAERFVQEAWRWDRLDDHPHVVEVLDWGIEPYPWLFLEFMDGGDLGERVGDLSIEESLSILTDICDAVNRAAHRHGVVHADLKPGNVMFSTNGGEETVKVGDWGLARLLLRHSTSLEQLTPEYAAPEQVDPDGSIDVPYTDVYQLGVVAYELFTGEPPFDYESESAIVNAKNEGETPPSPSERADVPAGVDEIVSTAMAQRKQDRYETVVNLRNDLEDVLDAL